MNSQDPDRSTADATPSTTPSLSRRVALASGIAATASAGGFLLGRDGSEDDGGLEGPSTQHAATTSPHGVVQRGIAEPAPRQAHASVLVFDLIASSGTSKLLDRLGEAIADFVDGKHLNGLDPSGLTVTVGLGSALVATLLGPTFPGAADLPSFSSDDIADGRRGGDLMLQVCSDEPAVNGLVEANVRRLFSDELTPRWRETGFRGKLDRSVGRNLLGFHDGLSIPRTDADLEADVWLSDPPALAGATLAVVRVMPIDVRGFTSLPLPEQEEAVGRQRASGRPLSGGAPEDDVDLHAKLTSGEYAIDNSAHTRRAHPLPAGANGLMLRRSYSYFNGPADQGLLFISFQDDIETFVRTQRRIDEGDALLDHTSTTAAAAFLVLPGFDTDRGLGAIVADA